MRPRAAELATTITAISVYAKPTKWGANLDKGCLPTPTPHTVSTREM